MSNLPFGFVLSFKLGLSCPKDFTANNFSKDLCDYLVLPNSCFKPTREQRGPGWERWFKQEWRDWEAHRQENTVKEKSRRRDMQTDTQTKGHKKRDDSNMWDCPHLLDCVRSHKQEEESGRNKTISMNSTPGNVGFLDNSGHSKTNGPFHNNSKQTQMSPLLAPRH